MPGLEEIESMPSFIEKKMRHSEGVSMTPTIDAYTTPGCVLMAHEDKDILKRDYERIRELEKVGLYKLRKTIPLQCSSEADITSHSELHEAEVVC